MASTLIGGLAVAAPAMAQDSAEDDVVVITGSRIQRTDTVAPSPITTVDEELFELNNVVNTEDLLNTLPQLIPAFDATSNNPGNGTATVSLRGLGASRTLVLVDGSRFVGSGAEQIVDLNNIPAALVERVDVVTGGASAVYGSDAVAGVVNFILRDDFEGVEVSTSHEFSLDQGDASITDVSVTVGGNFDNGRGNAVLSYGYTNREAVFQAARPFSEQAYWSPGPGNAPYDPGGSSNIPGTLILGDGFTVMTDTSGNPVPWSPYNYAPTNYLQLPQERHMISGFATYEINDHVEFYSRGIYANNVVDSQLAPTPTGGIDVTVNTDTNPYLSDALRDLLINDATYDPLTGTNDITVARRMQEFGTRNSLRDTNTFQALVGLRGDINSNWAYDVFYNYSRSSISQIQSGNISVSAFQNAVFCDPSNTAASCDGVPGLDIWNGPDSILGQPDAQDAIDYVIRTGAQVDVVEAAQFVASVNGQLQNAVSPFADIAPSVALGVEYRENSADIRPDSVLGPDVAGFNQSLAIAGSFDVYEFFTEVDVPLITNRPGVESLSFTGAFRMSDYSTIGTASTYSAGLGWEPVEDLLFRAQYNRAVRAPNLGDLFAPFTNGFPGAQDPCSSNRGSYGDGSAVNDATCVAHGAVPGDDFQLNAQIETLFGGNTELTEEVADTFTVGAVWQPNFVEGLTLQVDYYDIQIEDAISYPLLQTILNECYQQDIAESCALIEINGRQASGALNPIPLQAANLAVFDAEGVDVRVDYVWDAEQMGLSSDLGSFAVNYYSTFTITNGSQNTPESAYISCEGIFGGECGEPTPEYKHVMQASWYLGALTTSMRWRHVGGVDLDPSVAPDVSDAEQAIDGFNYFDVTFGYDVSEAVRVSVGIQNVTDEQPPVLTSTTSEQANTWPATYDPFGRRLFLGANLRF